jgi:hypothetical protein
MGETGGSTPGRTQGKQKKGDDATHRLRKLDEEQAQEDRRHSPLRGHGN